MTNRPEPYWLNGKSKKLSGVFAKTLVIMDFGIVLYVCLGQQNGSLATECPLDERGLFMSRLSSKIAVAVILGFTALTASGCTLPLTFDPGTSGLTFSL